MARMFPRLTKNEIRASNGSRAELRAYEALQSQLPREAAVFFSRSMIRETAVGMRADLEADFVIVWPGLGILVVEVKGGGISKNDSDHWSSVDRHGNLHEIHDPFKQARQQKHEILKLLQGHHRWRSVHANHVAIGHAVIFPDMQVNGDFVAAGRPSAITGGFAQMQRMAEWVSGALKYWANRTSNLSHVTEKTVEIATEILCGRTIFAKPLLSTQLAAEEQVRLRLTDDQGRIIRCVRNRSRIVIDGGAGTGKTILALQHAKECARDGQRTLLLCYQQRLAEMLAFACKGVSKLRACSLHKLAEDLCRDAFATSGADLDRSIREHLAQQQIKLGLDEQAMARMLLAAERLPDVRFDSVIVDEGQMIGSLGWLAIEKLLRTPTSRLIIFRDPEQTWKPFGRRNRPDVALPVTEPPLLLCDNCRNTAAIHRLAYRFYKGPRVDPPRDIEGECPQYIDAKPPTECVDGTPEVRNQAAVRALVVQIRDVVRNWTENGGVPRRGVAVLLCHRPDDFKREFKNLSERMGDPRDYWAISQGDSHPGVRVETLRRYQGLEAECVVLVLPDGLRRRHRRQAMYIGSTRAKSRLVIVAQDVSKLD